jgi:hypothetical protein
MRIDRDHDRSKRSDPFLSAVSVTIRAEIRGHVDETWNCPTRSRAHPT